MRVILLFQDWKYEVAPEFVHNVILKCLWVTYAEMLKESSPKNKAIININFFAICFEFPV